MWEKFKNWAWNTVKVPWRLIGTAGLLGADIIKTGAWIIQDIPSVVINTTNKIIDLFSQDLKRYQKAANIPVAIWVWLDWAVETAIKPIVNALGNTLKSGTSLVSNVYQSIRNVFSTKPTKMDYNTIKRKWKAIKLDTEKRRRDQNNLLTENRWFLPKEKKKAYLEKKKAKIESLISKL